MKTALTSDHAGVARDIRPSTWKIRTSVGSPVSDMSRAFSSTPLNHVTMSFLVDVLFGDFENRVLSFRHLGRHWDSHGAEAPNETAISNALLALKRLKWGAMMPKRVNPSSDEGIFMEVQQNGATLLFEFFNTGEIGIVRKSARGTELIEITADQIEKTIHDLTNG